MDYTGRRIPEVQLVEQENLIRMPTMEEKGDKVRCLRCNEIHLKKTVQLPTGAYYCPSCIELGRVSSNQLFYHKPSSPRQPLLSTLTWQGELTQGQALISKQVVQMINEEKNLLVHAVTGAGKTEMIFEGIERAFALGKRVGIAIPRVDVCLELYPRMKEAFDGVDICLLHGRSDEQFRDTPLVICMTHQLLRFYRHFDVCIVDEVDAFPFVYNQALAFALKNALKEKASLIYLTATPTKELMKRVRKKELQYTALPARFHRKPLVEPRFLWCKNWRKVIEKKGLPKTLKKCMEQCIADDFPFLIFCPVIELLEKLETAIRKAFPDLRFSCVSSIDPKRLEKVEKMRNHVYQMLVTTTILERGVTFADVSVIILGANHKVYSPSSLVQISGRVGRKLSRSNGRLVYLHDGKTKAMVEAKRQIQKMNQLAREMKLLDIAIDSKKKTI